MEKYENITILSQPVSVSAKLSNREIENNKETWCAFGALLLSVSKQVSFVNLVFSFGLFTIACHAGSHFE